MDLPVEVTLKRPFTVDGQTYKTLSFDEPTLGAQIAYAELEADLGVADLRRAIEMEEDPLARADIIPPAVSMRINLFWIEALADLPKGAAQKIKASDQQAVTRAVDTILGLQQAEDEGQDAAGNDVPVT